MPLYILRQFDVKKQALTGILAMAIATTSWANGGERFPFHVGEKLTYQIFWGPFAVGRATLEVTGIEPVEGHDCYRIVAQAHTSGLAEALYPVRAKTESWLDVEGLFSRRYRQDRTENKRRKFDETVFDYQHKMLVTTNLLSGRTTRIPLNGPVQDMISSLYYVRTRPLMLDAEQSFVVNASRTNYTVNFTPDVRKNIWTKGTGDTPALRIEPKPTLTIVAANKGRMWFWVSDDQRHLPLLVTSDMKIGNAKLVLFEVESSNPAFSKSSKSARPSITPR